MNGGKISYYYMNDPRWSQPNYGGLALIDWQDEFFRLAPIQNYQLSVSNGNKNSKYRLSLGYIDQQGVAIETSYKRLNLRANVESRLFDRITMGFNIAPTMTWNEGGSIEGKDQQAQKVLSMCPIAEPDAGVYEGEETYESYLWASSNVSPIAFMEQFYLQIVPHGLNYRCKKLTTGGNILEKDSTFKVMTFVYQIINRKRIQKPAPYSSFFYIFYILDVIVISTLTITVDVYVENLFYCRTPIMESPQRNIHTVTKFGTQPPFVDFLKSDFPRTVDYVHKPDILVE